MLSGAIGPPGLQAIDAVLAARATQALEHVLRTLRAWTLGPLQDACHALAKATGGGDAYPTDGPETYAAASAAMVNQGGGGVLLDVAALGQCLLLRSVRATLWRSWYGYTYHANNNRHWLGS